MISKYSLCGIVCVLIFLGLCVVQAFADDQDIAKESQNPVAARISLPMKNKFNFDAGPEDAFIYELEMQPVYPMNLGKLNLITLSVRKLIMTPRYSDPGYVQRSRHTSLSKSGVMGRGYHLLS
jgi:hypothetical protein